MHPMILFAAALLAAFLPEVDVDRVRKVSPAPSGRNLTAPVNPAGAVPVVIVTSQNAGPSPFISELHLTINVPSALKSIRFRIDPKPGSVTRPIAATYTSGYLQSRGYFNTGTGEITVRVFGLYADSLNGVVLTSQFTDGSSQTDNIVVPTGPFTHPCGLSTPTVLQPRTTTTELSYDFVLMKSLCDSPTIVDTDGAVRWWVSNATLLPNSTAFIDNVFYVAAAQNISSDVTGLARVELDGTFTFEHDYSDIGVVNSGHHNIDPGKFGLIMEVDTTSQVESVALEVDYCGNVLKRWDMADIISAAMIAGGDDPTEFVKATPIDWFHMNSATYRKSDDSMIFSSREQFVMCVDYETGALKWLLGDPTKKWHQFQSLRNYALDLGSSTLPPIGQHAVSFTYDNELLLFDDGKSSLNQGSGYPSGDDRTYSAPRKYHLDLQNNVATEIWNYPNGQSLYSPFCSTVYEDAPLNYFVDYSIIMNLGPDFLAQILGLTPKGEKVFEYRYPTANCNTAWNAIPVHLENLLFAVPDPNDLQIHALSVTASASVVEFSAVAGNSYRFEYKDSLGDKDWQLVSTYVADCTGPVALSDTGSAGQTQRFHRITLVEP